MAVRFENEQALVQEHVDGLASRALDHELGAGLAEDGRSVVDELARVGLDAQIDAAPGVGSRRAGCNGDRSA